MQLQSTGISCAVYRAGGLECTRSTYPDTHADAEPEIAAAFAHFFRRPYVRLRHVDQRKQVVGLAHLAGAGAVELAVDRHQRAGGIVEWLDIAVQYRDETAAAAVVRAGPLRR